MSIRRAAHDPSAAARHLPRKTREDKEIAIGAPLTRRRALRVHIDGVERLARRHEQAVPLGTAEADVAHTSGRRMRPISLPPASTP